MNRKITESSEAKKNETMSQLPDRGMKVKLFYIVTALLLAFVVWIIYELYSTAVVQSEYLRTRANTQQLDEFTINANRGTIYDRSGKILAKSTVVWNVILSPYDINKNNDEPEQIAQMLSEILELDFDNLMERMENPSIRYDTVARRITREQYDEITRRKEEKGLAHYSVYLIEDTMRVYPNDSLAANIIGFTNFDNEGVYGVEAFYDEQLQGTNGRVVTLRDGAGRVMPSEFERRFPASNGNNLHMTIDVNLQHYLERHLEEAVFQHNVANRATGIMMEPNTGAILAKATTGGFDLNSPSTLSEADESHLESVRNMLTERVQLETIGGTLSESQIEDIERQVRSEREILREIQWRNKAITELYFPGSVFKTVTAAIALEERAIDFNTSSFNCHGFVDIGPDRIRCWVYGRGRVHGGMNLTEAMTHSCNPAFMDIGDRVGASRFYDFLEAFGLTRRTGIDVPAEASPILIQRDNMRAVDLAMSSIGQTNKITPLQMITAFAACINGGYLVTPHVVSQITDNDGNVVSSNDAGVKRQILSSETSAQMRQMMEDVVRANGGSNAYISGFRIGGKSGTSEKIDEYSPYEMRYVASFGAFAPADNPQVILLVVVDEPNPYCDGPIYGSQVAAPVVSAVLRDSFQHLEIFPQFTAEEQALQDTLVPNVIGESILDAGTALSRAGLLSHEIGEGSRVVKTVPEAGTTIRRGSTIVLYFDTNEAEQPHEVVVPDVYRMSVNAANQAIVNAGLNIRLTGGAVGNENAVAVYMSIEPGTVLPKGTVVEVRFTVDEGHGG
ncbi:MAG: penicillin-binding transpeptidase domain-containing protein [Oscillospiraceae bacterium]|nr:penicillin-binding transpeptidase domain-containing protein [Oscillospiraceae bacterium]